MHALVCALLVCALLGVHHGGRNDVLTDSDDSAGKRPLKSTKIDAGELTDSDDKPAASSSAKAHPHKHRHLVDFKKRLYAGCHCSIRRQHRLSKKPRLATQKKVSCFTQSLESHKLWQALVDWHEHFASMHKLEQDDLLFRMLRDLAISQGALDVSRIEPEVGQQKLQYNLFGVDVCKQGYAFLLRVGWNPRLDSIIEAVFQGCRGPKVDLRYLKQGLGSKPTVMRGEIVSHLQQLWESVAETLPCGDDKCDDPLDEMEDDNYAHINIREQVGITSESHSQSQLRFLPPGTIFDQWRQFQATSKISCGFKLFWQTWTQYFGHKLQFRRRFMHAVCPVCVKHKQMIRMLTHNLGARQKQRALYDRHLKGQHNDRLWYWFLRAQSRMVTPVICIILDGMDQAKFMWPRDPVFGSHEFDYVRRPRLHILGFIVHGYIAGATISHADTHKGSGTTIDVLCWLLTTLAEQGVHLSNTHLHVQLDNTASSNKNNIILLWMGLLVICGIVKTCTANFLRTGHTHEDVDQMFGEIANWLWKKLPHAETLMDFTKCLEQFFAQLNRPHEGIRLVKRFDNVRCWKTFVLNIKKRITGIVGPSAPHSFSMQLRAQLPAGHKLIPGVAHDVVLRCRQWMKDSHDCAAATYITKDDVSLLPGSLPMTLAPKARIEKKYIDQLLRFAKHIRQLPFRMNRAADELVGWIERSSVALPLLDVSACEIVLRSAALDQSPLPLPLPAVDPDVGALGFEPVPSIVSVVVGRALALKPDVANEASTYAKFAYPMAASLVELHDYSWDMALDLSRACWKSLQKMSPVAPADPSAELMDGPLAIEDIGEEAETPPLNAHE